MFSEKNLKLITQILLLSVVAIIPFLRTYTLYFPYISPKVYVFRLLVALAFFFWIWLLWTRIYADKKRINTDKKISTNQLKSALISGPNILVVSLILFFLAQVFVSFFGVDPLYSFFSSVERGEGVLQYGFWVLYCLMLISVFRKKQDWKLLFFVFVITAVLVSIYAWFRFKDIRLYALFGNPSYLSVFLLFAIGFGFTTLERKFFKNIFSQVFIFLAIVLFIITLIFTQTRGAYLGLAGGIFLFCLLATLFLRGEEDKSSSSTLRYARVKENKKLALFCGIILLVGVISVVTLFSARESDFVQKTYILKRTTEVANLWQDETVKERFLTWQIAFKAFKEKPIFGWGPENFGSAFNKYYDYRIGKAQPWFDRAHSQPIDTLATGGVILFSFYLFFLGAVIYTIFKIGRQNSGEKKVLSFILASIFLAYFLQGIFLFDTLPTFLGLFPFLAFLVFSTSRQTQMKTDERQINTDKNYKILVPVCLISLFIIWTTAFIPYKANALALKFHFFIEKHIYNKEVKSFLEQSYAIKSPYTFWELRKRTGWRLVEILEYNVNDKTGPEEIKSLKEIYDYITPELEKFAENKPYDPQIYYILGTTYRLGFQKLGKNDLEKAERILEKGFNYSDFRVEYLNELIRVFFLEGKIEEAEILIKEYTERLPNDDYLSYLLVGHLHFLTEKYEQAMEEYEKARELGYKFYEDEMNYIRYMLTAKELGDYQKIVDTAQGRLEKLGPDADTFFNIAVGYLNLEEKEKAKEFFLKAVELNKKYEQYRPFFEN